MQASNFGGTFDQLFLWIFLWNFHRRCLSTSSIPWCKKVKNDQKLKSRGGRPALKLYMVNAEVVSFNRPFAQLWPGNEVRGIVGESRLRCVCFSFELSFFFCFWMSFNDPYGVPRCSNRVRACPLLFSHSFPWSSELRKRWLFAIRQADWSNFRVPNSTIVCIEHRSSLRKSSLSCSCLKACRLFHYQLFETEEGWTLPESRCSAIGVFSSPADVSHVRVRST